MPSLFRFLLTLAILGGLGYAGLWALATFIEPQSREMSQTIPAARLNTK
ncbi:histidine kinase [Beijerinckia indica]|uniref:Histidine kinase n=1 Tax=Beijerinckia indica subsp. indica (strain ATCC 9039 / DSM 1715 / NCIMB 8712) TaxID=395963 RepID=B2IEM3_BEII9|nr:histidine kinase [Beijerinckia indica]ACB96963.1 conserved hypothetical protein [Beijerinckia indica subsp. indica ATCC 9039]